MAEKLCIFCEHFRYDNIYDWQSDCSGGSEGGYTCNKNHYYEERPSDQKDLRKILLRADKCKDYSPPEPKE
jgi:hypothetical protein